MDEIIKALEAAGFDVNVLATLNHGRETGLQLLITRGGQEFTAAVTEPVAEGR